MHKMVRLRFSTLSHAWKVYKHNTDFVFCWFVRAAQKTSTKNNTPHRLAELAKCTSSTVIQYTFISLYKSKNQQLHKQVHVQLKSTVFTWWCYILYDTKHKNTNTLNPRCLHFFRLPFNDFFYLTHTHAYVQLFLAKNQHQDRHCLSDRSAE